MAPTPASDDPPHRRDDGGFSLLELLIGVVILGIAGVAVLTTWSVGISTTSRQRDLTDTQTVLSSAADLVTSATTQRVACQGTGPATNAGAILQAYTQAARRVALPSSPGWDAAKAVEVTAVEFWDGGLTGDVFSATCHEADGDRLQQLTITVTSPKGLVQRVQVVKGDA